MPPLFVITSPYAALFGKPAASAGIIPAQAGFQDTNMDAATVSLRSSTATEVIYLFHQQLIVFSCIVLTMLYYSPRITHR